MIICSHRHLGCQVLVCQARATALLSDCFGIVTVMPARICIAGRAQVRWKCVIRCTKMARCGRYRSNSYSKRASRSAQAVTTAELGVSVPGTVAQVPFSMIDRRSQIDALPNSFNFAGASACCWNLSAQIGASTSLWRLGSLLRHLLRGAVERPSEKVSNQALI